MYQSEQRSANETRYKEPWLAVNLSRLLPGIGQIYAGKRFKGYIILLSYFLLTGISGWLILGTNNPLLGVFILIATLVLLPIWNLFDAHHSARSANSLEFESARKQSKDAWLAVFLSSFIPGLGHAYLQKSLPSILFFIAFISPLILAISGNLTSAVLLQLAQPILFVFAFYHVYNATPPLRERSQRTILLFIAGFIGIVVFSIPIFVIMLRQFVMEARYIPSEAMLPILQVNDRLIIDKLTYRFRMPERGDIVLFSPTETLKKQNFQDASMKRIIGLPGETVEVKGGRVYINTQPLAEPYVTDKPEYQWGPTTIPPNSYFVLGDNRNNSYDSHYWGFVPRENIIGKASQRFYPLDRSGSLIGK